MRRWLTKLIAVFAIVGTLGFAGLTTPNSASANDNCVAWSAQYGCEATIACILVTEPHGYCGVYWTAGPNAGGFDMLFF